MIDVSEIEREIQRLELDDLSYQNCTKLAVLYSVLDHNKKKNNRGSSYSDAQSEFIRVCSDAPYTEVLSILDEHMQTISILYPKEYTMLINKIKNLLKN